MYAAIRGLLHNYQQAHDRPASPQQHLLMQATSAQHAMCESCMQDMQDPQHTPRSVHPTVLPMLSVAGPSLLIILLAAVAAFVAAAHHHSVPAGSTTTMSCIGFLLLLLGQRRMIVATCAGLISVLPILAAVAALLSQPEWVQQGSARVAADSLQGLAAGYSTYVLLLLLLPMVRQWGSRAAGLSLWGGAAAGCLVCLALKALCASTPYCLHVNGAGVLG